MDVIRRHNDSSLEIFPTATFSSHSIQEALEAASLLRHCPAAEVWTSPLAVTKPVSCHKHIPKLPVGGASLALRKFHSVTNSLHFPLKLFPKCSDITYLVTHLGLRNEPPENGWMGIRWPLPSRGGNGTRPSCF